jgi:3-amino-4-hydroxybenzoic acid synthase
VADRRHTCSNFFRDEGLLVGAFGGGFLLCCSETHPLPYMPTRPFRVNAGAVSSYILSSPDRTNYLSELRQGHTVTAVRVNGDTRPVVVGRAKIETRPLLLVKARSADGDEASLMLQYDWHVRMLGRAGAVHNITELTPGSIILGYAAARAPRRHGCRRILPGAITNQDTNASRPVFRPPISPHLEDKLAPEMARLA